MEFLVPYISTCLNVKWETTHASVKTNLYVPKDGRNNRADAKVGGVVMNRDLVAKLKIAKIFS